MSIAHSLRCPRFSCISLSCVLLLPCACSPVRTIVKPENAKDNFGLVYYLPLQAVNVTLTVSKADKATPTRSIGVTTSAVFADHTNRFIAQYRSNQLGTNALNVGVTADGLLDKDTTSTLTTKVSDVLSGFATALAPPFALGSAPSSKPCEQAGTYTWTFVPTKDRTSPSIGTLREVDRAMDACGISVVARALTSVDSRPIADLFGLKSNGADASKCTDGHTITCRDSDSGFFYRQSFPYVLEVTDTTQHSVTDYFVSLPTYDSPVEFLPVQKSLFANNTVKITFDHGMPTVYSESVDSEWLGVVSIPAAVIKAYMTAIADAFKSKGDANSAQATYLAGVNSLMAQQLKTKLCLQAISTKQSEDQIKAACQ